MVFLSIFYIFITSINSKNLFNLDKQSSLNILDNNILNTKNNKVNYKIGFNYRQLITNIFSKYYKECSENWEKMDPLWYNITTPPIYPMYMIHSGLDFNDIKDEVECKSYYNSNYILVISTIIFNNGNDRILFDFLDLKYYTVTACGAKSCDNFVRLLAINFALSAPNNNETSNIEIYFEDEEIYENNKIFKTFVWIFIVYVLIKILVGVIRIIYIPKGYDIYAAKILNEKGKLPFLMKIKKDMVLIHKIRKKLNIRILKNIILILI